MFACFVVLSLVRPLQGGTEEAQKILDACKERLVAAKTLSGSMSTSIRGQGKPVTNTSTFLFQKPNLFSIKGDVNEIIGDGTATYMYMVSNKQYMKLPTASTDIPASMAIGFEPFFGEKSRFQVSKIGMGSFKGQPAAEVTYAIPNSNLSLSMYVSKDTQLPLGYFVKSGEMTNAATYSDVKVDDAIPAESFKWSPPEGATERNENQGPDEYEKNLLKVGSQAPDFTIKTPQNADLNLTRSLKGSKGMLVNFWFYG
jgi:outer membrane lipoprotein-sorting protein